MKKLVLMVLFVFVAATSAFAADSVEPFAVTANATVGAAEEPMTLASALDKVGREYKEMWIKDQTGKKVKRACIFQCTQACGEYRNECYNNGWGQVYCEGQWNLCMCENNCCSGPYGNPYCD